MEKQRLDFLVAHKLGVSRSSAVNLIESGNVKVNGKIKDKPSLRFDQDSALEIKKTVRAKSPELDLPVIYEDKNCVVINKPAGVLVHSKGAFSSESTVASWLAPKTRGFDKANNRAGIVHRLDRGTSGVMICAKTPEVLAFFQKQFSLRRVKKTYFALIEGKIDPAEAVIDIPIERNPKDPKRFKASANGKPAQTAYSTVKIFESDTKTYSLLELVPKTGRTHQLRVHLAYMKRPIIGDDFYGGVKAERLYLHAASLEINFPAGGREIFDSPLPGLFLEPKITVNG